MIIITGTIAYDYIMDFPGKFQDHVLPDQLHAINLSFIVNKFERRRGGTAGNASYTLGLLKNKHILFSYAGKDFAEYTKGFTKLGIPTNFVKIDRKTYTATGFAMTDKKDNQIWGYFYGAAVNIPQLVLKNVANKKDLVLIGPSGAAGSMSFVNQCISSGIPYMFDPGFILTQVSNADLKLGIQHAMYVIGNDYEINLIKSRIKNWKKIFATKIIITTLGDKGAKIEDKGRTFDIPIAKISDVVDPTGAGDAWRGGFLSGIEKGFDMQTCGQMGAIASAYAVESYGTQEHFYTKKSFVNRYRQNFKSLLEL